MDQSNITQVVRGKTRHRSKAFDSSYNNFLHSAIAAYQNEGKFQVFDSDSKNESMNVIILEGNLIGSFCLATGPTAIPMGKNRTWVQVMQVWVVPTQASG